ncbi:RNA polymerase sigma factor (sigma-70 family) [Paenibacillus barcinonensis]|uniref:RNA polymerase sigma factor (Sigma-70 family) n=1 Tax=Paenibacillus barcinonensis TaxID=198119 RepID=A0A2V4W3N5_PAEBA|nr:RNA polymerase sigma factor (sigma-70 family) [Paenibacillus barcinonensis]
MLKLWIDGALRGEPEAYEQLVAQYRGMALAVAYQLLQDAYAAEDVVQEAFTEAFGNLVKLERPEAFPGWFKVIVQRQCYRWLRRKRHTVVPLEELDEAIRADRQDHDPESQTMHKELQQTLRSSIARLPSTMQIVVDLFYFQGYTLQEISEFLGVSISALKKRLFDARVKLKRSVPVRNLASTFNELYEGGKGMLHIMNGDHAASRLRESGIQGDIMVWRELYTYGPVTTDMTGRKARQHRAVVLEDELGIPQKQYLQIEGLEHKLLSLKPEQEIVLWFEHDLYDQTMLSYILYFLSEKNLMNLKLNLLCIDSFPQVEHFRGLGQLTPAQMQTLSGTWHVIQDEEIEAGRELWEAYTSPDVREHERYLKQCSQALPFASAAFQAHLSRLPSQTNGLSIIEQTTLETIMEGIQHAPALFHAVGGKLPVLGMGDLEYWAHLNRMSKGTYALIRMTGAESFPKYNQHEHAFDDATVSVTELGIQVLNGEVDWGSLREDEYWVGGLHVIKGRVCSMI